MLDMIECIWNKRIKVTLNFEFVCEKPINKQMLICVACGNGSFDIEKSHPKQGGTDYAKRKYQKN